MKIQSFEDLSVWKKGHELVLDIYRLTGELPADEKFGLVSQMRRAAVSAAANIAEGFRRRGFRDKLNFYNISQSSLSELRYYLILVKDLEYVSIPDRVNLLIEEIGKMLHGLMSSVEHRPNP